MPFLNCFEFTVSNVTPVSPGDFGFKFIVNTEEQQKDCCWPHYPVREMDPLYIREGEAWESLV